MAEYTIIKLKHLSPLHMGTGKENYDFSASQLHSDTLSAALAAMKAKYIGTDGLYDFLNSFTISSAFPYVGEHFFLPRPLGKMNVTVTDCDEYISRKKLKKVQFIELGLWQKMIAGERVEIESDQLEDAFILDKTDPKFCKPYKSSVHQRVVVPREDNKDTEPFFFDWTFFHQNAGLYCLINAEESLLKELQELFEKLGEDGIGTDKNVGGGKFTIEPGSLNIDGIEGEGTRKMLLSLYIPTKEEIEGIDLENSTYELRLRGGYMAGSIDPKFWHLRKKSVYMFGVGSLLVTSSNLEGEIVDLCPENCLGVSNLHSAFRSGKPFVVSVKL